MRQMLGKASALTVLPTPLDCISNTPLRPPAQAPDNNPTPSCSVVNVPADELRQFTGDLARRFVTKSSTIMALGRASFMRANDLDYRRNVENQIETLCNVFSTADGREGLQAFLEKRPPQWQSL